MESLPPGITIGRWTDARRSSFFLRFGPRHDRKVISFESEAARNDAAEARADDLKRNGTASFDFDPAEWRRYLDFRTRCKAPLPELERLWQDHEAKSQTQLVRDAVTRYLALRLSEDIRENSDTHRHLKLHLGRLVAQWGVLRLDEMTPDRIREALQEIVSERTGKPIGDLAKRHHRKDWNTFFKRCVTEEWCSKNPCSAVVPPRVETGRRKILTPEQAFKLFKANAGEPVIGRLALEAFGGLRASSAERILKEHVRFAERGLVLMKDEGDQEDTHHKSGAPKYRQGHPPVLWDWLNCVPDACWTDIDRNNYGHRKVRAFDRAHVKNSGNVLRHSFASYLLALAKSYSHVGYLMQHTKTSTTEVYEGVAGEAEARMYFAITREAVRLTWDEFKTRWQEFYAEPVIKR